MINPQLILEGHWPSFLGKAQLIEGALDKGAGLPDDVDGNIEANILALRRLADKLEAAIGKLDREAA